MADDLVDKLKELVAEWRSRQFNYGSDRNSAEQYARNDGKEEAYSNAADELDAIMNGGK